jgi:hypothetical protein
MSSGFCCIAKWFDEKNVGDLHKKFRPNRFIAVQHDTIPEAVDNTRRNLTRAAWAAAGLTPNHFAHRRGVEV